MNKSFGEVVVRHLPAGSIADKKKVFLRKTAYRFVDSVIQEQEDPSEPPVKLSQCIGHLQTECVYEVVFKGASGQFLSLK